MKLSLLLVSVNLAATLPILIPCASMAEEAVSDKASWLKSSLAAMSPEQGSELRTTKKIHRLRYSEPIMDNGKMRPFVAGRKLPRQRELDVVTLMPSTPKLAQPILDSLTAETPQFAPSSKPLSGRVADSVYRNDNVATYGSVGYIKQFSSCIVPGQTPVLPGQLRQFKTKKPRQSWLRIEPPKAAFAPKPVQVPRLLPEPACEQVSPHGNSDPPPPIIQPTADLPPTQPHPIEAQEPPPQTVPSVQALPPIPQRSSSPQEQALIDRQVASAHPHTFDKPTAGDLDPTWSSAGPAPFPLSLLPQDQLRRFIVNGRHRHCDAAPSYFGSWHNNSKITAQPGSNLTPAKCLSQVQRPCGGPPIISPCTSTQTIHIPTHVSRFSNSSARVIRLPSPRVAHSTITDKIHSARVLNYTGSDPDIGRNRRLGVAPQEYIVASYPPYNRLPRSVAF